MDSWPSGSAQPGQGENVEQGVEVALVGCACLAVRLSDGSGGDGAGFVGDEGLRGHGGWVAYETKILWIGSHVGLWWTVGQLAQGPKDLGQLSQPARHNPPGGVAKRSGPPGPILVRLTPTSTHTFLAKD